MGARGREHELLVSTKRWANERKASLIQPNGRQRSLLVASDSLGGTPEDVPNNDMLGHQLPHEGRAFLSLGVSSNVNILSILLLAQMWKPCRVAASRALTVPFLPVILSPALRCRVLGMRFWILEFYVTVCCLTVVSVVFVVQWA